MFNALNQAAIKRSLFKRNAPERSLFKRALEALADTLEAKDSNSANFDDEDIDAQLNFFNETTESPIFDDFVNETILEDFPEPILEPISVDDPLADSSDDDVDDEDELPEEEYSAEEISIATQIVRFQSLVRLIKGCT